MLQRKGVQRDFFFLAASSCQAPAPFVLLKDVFIIVGAHLSHALFLFL